MVQKLIIEKNYQIWELKVWNTVHVRDDLQVVPQPRGKTWVTLYTGFEAQLFVFKLLHVSTCQPWSVATKCVYIATKTATSHLVTCTFNLPLSAQFWRRHWHVLTAMINTQPIQVSKMLTLHSFRNGILNAFLTFINAHCAYQLINCSYHGVH